MIHTVRFQILMVVNINIAVFWDVTPCGLVERHKHFVGTCYIQGILQMEGEGSSETVAEHHIIESCNLTLIL
jgi:hypothetical protein